MSKFQSYFNLKDWSRFIVTRSGRGLSALLVLVYVVARLWNVASVRLFDAEIFSLRAARQSWAALFDHVLADAVHPPLFYVLLKLWILIGGESMLWLHLFPALTAIAAIVPLFFLARELRLSLAETNLALLLLAVNGYLVFYSIHLRMYSLLLLFTFCSLWLFIRFFKSKTHLKRSWLMLTGINLLLVYTHYYGWLVVMGEFIFLLLWNRRKLLPFSAAAAIVAVTFMPWIFLVTQHQPTMPALTNINWIKPPTGESLIQYSEALNGSLGFPGEQSLLFLGLGILLFVWAWHLLQNSKKDSNRDAATFWFLVSLFFLPGIVSFLVSWIGPKPIWHHRFLIITAAPYVFLVSLAVHRVRSKWLKTIAVVVVATHATLAGFKYRDWTRRANWESVEPLVVRMVQAEPLGSGNISVYVFARDEELPRMVRGYLYVANDKRFQVLKVKDYEAEKHFWVVTAKPVVDPSDSVKAALRTEGFRTGESFETGASRRPKVIIFPVWKDGVEF